MNIKPFFQVNNMKLRFLKNEGFNIVCFKVTKSTRAKKQLFLSNKSILRQKSFKYFLSLIYYHILINKKVLFLSNIMSFEVSFFKVLRKLSHSFFPLQLFIPGFFSNQFAIKTMLQANYLMKKPLFFSLKKNKPPSLVVFITTKSNYFFTKVTHKTQMPSILLKLPNTKGLYVFSLFFKSMLNSLLN